MLTIIHIDELRRQSQKLIDASRRVTYVRDGVLYTGDYDGHGKFYVKAEVKPKPTSTSGNFEHTSGSGHHKVHQMRYLASLYEMLFAKRKG